MSSAILKEENEKLHYYYDYYRHYCNVCMNYGGFTGTKHPVYGAIAAVTEKQVARFRPKPFVAGFYAVVPSFS